MTANAAVFDYVPLDRGPRRIGHYRDLNAAHTDVAGGESFIERVLREYSHRSYNRIASAAGPLTPEYAVRLFKATMSLFVRSEVQRSAMEQRTGKPVPAAKANGSGHAKGRTVGGGAKGLLAGFGLAFGEPARPSDMGFWNSCSCAPAKKPELH